MSSTTVRIQDLPLTERPRERLVLKGADALSHSELIAILLRTGSPGQSAMQLADGILRRFGSLGQLAGAPLDELRVRGLGRDKAIQLKAAFTLARRLAEEIRVESPVLDHPEAVAGLMRDEMACLETEHLKVLLLNTRRRLIRVVAVATGLLDQIVIHPREVFRPAVAAGAHAVVLVHNHPSGDPSPSEGDIRATSDLRRAGQLLKIELLDHLIIGRRSNLRSRDFASMRELGYLA